MGCYFLNINSQMNQWPSHVTGLGEFQNSYLDFVRSLRPHGEKFARFIKRDGFCFGHYTDCWKRTYFQATIRNGGQPHERGVGVRPPGGQLPLHRRQGRP